MHEAGHWKSVPWDNPEGWGGEGGGRVIQDGRTHVHPWLIHADLWQKSSQDCKVIILPLKLIIFLKERKKINKFNSKKKKKQPKGMQYLEINTDA